VANSETPPIDRDTPYRQVIELRGHIIDSLILPKVLDDIMDSGNEFIIQELKVGRSKPEPSYCRIEILAPSAEALQDILGRVQQVGAVPLEVEDVRLEPAPADGVFPENFYSTTNLPTFIKLQGQWIPVSHPEMDCGIVVDDDGARCIPMGDVLKGQLMVVGHAGIRVAPLERPREISPAFQFMSSAVSTEKPKSVLIAQIAREMRRARETGGKILVVAGPAVIHTASGDRLCRLIEWGYVNYLFAGNALAAHDIEWALYGTSLGVSLKEGLSLERGHEHHLRAINKMRMVGGIKRAVEEGALKRGIMYSCVRYGVEWVLGGSVRDDGPLPEVTTDVMEAQKKMREIIRRGDVRVVLMLSTMLHSIAVGNLLPANVTTVCVDINPSS